MISFYKRQKARMVFMNFIIKIGLISFIAINIYFIFHVIILYRDFNYKR